MIINFSTDKALIISGPEGSGKTRLAKKIAEKSLSTYRFITMSDLKNRPNSSIFDAIDDLFIVEEFTGSPDEFNIIKSIISDKKTPKTKFILVMSNQNMLNKQSELRRFVTISL